MESEDLMWKDIYNKLNKQESRNDKTEHEIRIQQVDGGFFEKFGSLFQEHLELESNLEIENKNNPDASPTDNLTETKNESSDTIPESDGATSISNVDVDLEKEENKEDKADLILFSWNIDELYSEILYEILNNVGCDVNCEIGQTALLSYLQDAFKISGTKHRELLAEAEQKEPPEILINVEIIEAKDLSPKDSNGLSDPFVTLYLASNTTHRYNTSVKMTTLSPIWEEHFALPISDNMQNDMLCLEVWDFDPAESVKEKFGKFFDVKGVKGVRKLMKEIAIAAATGQHENELIGMAKIPLKTVPASGITMWYGLDKKNKSNRQGVIKLRISFSSEKNTQVSEQEHRNLLRIILLHELETSKVAPYWWCGTFSPQGEAILTQHIAQSGLNPTEVALCQWFVYAVTHQNHTLSFNTFSNLLNKLVKPLQTGIVPEEDVKLFWDAAKKLLPSCFAIIRQIRKKVCGDKTTLNQIEEILSIVKMIETLDVHPSINIFPSNLYPWLGNDENSNRNIRTTLNDVVNQGATDWFNHIQEHSFKSCNTDAEKLQNLVQIIQLVRSDLQKAMEVYDKLFQQSIYFQYAKILYIGYQKRITELAKPDITSICKTLKRVPFTGLTLNETKSTELLTEGTILFEVYLALHRFVLLGKGLCPSDCDSFEIHNFHQWFHLGVAQWLDIAVFKALQRIEKAVELDNFVCEDSTVKYSSSAVDTITIFYQVKVFWQQLNWPDVEGCYTFIAKIIDDICRCCVFYAEQMSKRVEGMGHSEDIYEKKFEVTNEWCLAINNIEYVSQSLRPFTGELGMKEIIEKLSDLRSPLEAQRCQDTLDNVIENAVDTVHNAIIELLETVASKMVPAMKKLLIEGAELFNQDSNSIDRLMMYVDNNLSTLHNELNEENFNRILEIVWDILSDLLNEIIKSSTEKRRPPSFFANLHKTLNLMLGSFKNPDDSSNCNELQRTERLLKLNSLETNELIHQVHLDLIKEFKDIQDSKYGELSIKVKFEEDRIRLHVMNARNLIAMDSNGSCDSFVRIHLLPEHKFVGVPKPKTQTHNKTQFPLYDEFLTLNLSPHQKSIENGLLFFNVKDKDLLGYNNQYIGEALLRFDEIYQGNESLENLTPIRLPLIRPTNLKTDAVKILEQRYGDKQAKEFLRKLKQRIGS